jgi:hypothetical protein
MCFKKLIKLIIYQSNGKDKDEQKQDKEDEMMRKIKDEDANERG